MSISSIIHKELIDSKKFINVLWTNSDNKIIENYIRHNNTNINLIEFDDTFYGLYDIDIVVCNNRVSSLDKCLELCLFFHCPLIIIDHIEKPYFVNDLNSTYLFEPIYQIAISNNISNSWDRIHNKIIPYNDIIALIDIIENMSKEFIKLKIQIEGAVPNEKN